MPKPPTLKGIEHNSLPLPKTWAETIGLADYWERKDAKKRERQHLESCEFVDDDPINDHALPGYDETDK